jgi:hypothetical protein
MAHHSHSRSSTFFYILIQFSPFWMFTICRSAASLYLHFRCNLFTCLCTQNNYVRLGFMLYFFISSLVSFLPWSSAFSLVSSFVEWIGRWTKDWILFLLFPRSTPKDIKCSVSLFPAALFSPPQSWLATDFLPRFLFHHRRFVTAAGMMYTISLSTFCPVYSITNSIISSKASVEVRGFVLYFRILYLIIVQRTNKWQ